jgi:TctA family transporter
VKRDVLGPKISYVADLTLASGSMLKDFAMLFLGVLPGLGPYTGANRFTFGLAELGDGFEFIALVMRMFGIAEILRNLENETSRSVLSS